MERDIGYGGTAHHHRFYPGNRGDAACAPNLYIDAFDHRDALWSLELIGYGPPRMMTGVAQFLPHLYVVQLYYKAVYLVREGLPFLPLFFYIVCNSLGIPGREQRGPAVHLEPKLLKPFQHLCMGGQDIFFGEKTFVDKAVQRNLTRFGALLPPQCAGCQIPGVSIGYSKPVIHLRKGFKRQIYLSTGCQIHRLGKLKGYALHCLDIGCHIIAHKAVAPGCSLN